MEYEFEMPTPCLNCDDIFDLNDGRASEKWYPNKVICRGCWEKELNEIEDDVQFEDENINLTNSLFTFVDQKACNRLNETNRKLILQACKEIIEIENKNLPSPYEFINNELNDYKELMVSRNWVISVLEKYKTILDINNKNLE